MGTNPPHKVINEGLLSTSASIGHGTTKFRNVVYFLFNVSQYNHRLSRHFECVLGEANCGIGKPLVFYMYDVYTHYAVHCAGSLSRGQNGNPSEVAVKVHENECSLHNGSIDA